MRVPVPTSRSLKRTYLSLWDLFWAVGSPPLVLYLRDPEILFRADWTPVAYYWLFSTGFAVAAFYAFKIQDNMTRHFSVHEAIDIAETVLFVELMTFISLFTLTRFDGFRAQSRWRMACCWPQGSSRPHFCQDREPRRRSTAQVSLPRRAHDPDRSQSRRIVIHPLAQCLHPASTARHRGARPRFDDDWTGDFWSAGRW